MPVSDKWRTSWDAELTQLWEGMTNKALGEHFGVHNRTISFHAKRLGLPSKRTMKNKDVESVDREDLKDMVILGMSVYGISRVLGVRRDRTKELVYELGRSYRAMARNNAQNNSKRGEKLPY